MTIRSFLLTTPFVLFGGLIAFPAGAAFDPAALKIDTQVAATTQPAQILLADDSGKDKNDQDKNDKKEKKEKKEKKDKKEKKERQG